MKKYIGIDLHQQFSQIAVVSPDGKIIKEFKVLNYPDMFKHPSLKKIFHQAIVALEACNGWYWMVDALEEVGAEVHLAHPLKTKLIAEARVKTDKIDAKVLAHLLRTNFLPESYLAPTHVREARELHRHRAALVKIRTSVKNRVHSILSKLGVYFQSITDIFGVKGQEQLRKVMEKMKPIYREELQRYFNLIYWLDVEIEEIERQIKAIVKIDELTILLMTLPGIGEYSAYLIRSEIGDINRFANPKKLVSYVGLNPGVDISGKHFHSKHITKQGNVWLRWILIQNVPHAIKADERLRNIYLRIAKRKGRNTAKVAVARELLVAIYWVLKKRVPYCPKLVTPVQNMVS